MLPPPFNYLLTADRPDNEVCVAVGGIEKFLVDLTASVVLTVPSAIRAVGVKQLAHGVYFTTTVLPALDEPVARVELPHLVVAVLIDKILRFADTRSGHHRPTPVMFLDHVLRQTGQLRGQGLPE